MMIRPVLVGAVVPVALLVAGATLLASASAAVGSQSDWRVRLVTYVGEIGGLPADINQLIGVTNGATDGYDPDIDLAKPPRPFEYVWTWFNRLAWGQGDMQTDYRSELADATTKVWDDIRVKVKVAQDLSGVGDDCGIEDPCDVTEYYIASAIYLTWEFGTADQAPPADYDFTLHYKGGINAKPAGTAPAGVTVPAFGTAWDMKTSSNIVFPLWRDDFFPCDPSCQFQLLVDTAKFNINVINPLDNLPPVCSFTYSPAAPTTADPIEFADTSTDPDGNITSWEWEFGDGKVSVQPNPTHQYAAGGDYWVALTVVDDDGAAAACEEIVMVAGPVCCFSFAPRKPKTADAMPVQFLDCSTHPDGDIVHWYWHFGDAGTSTEQNPTHSYVRGGCFKVTLTVTDSSGAPSSCGQCVPVRSDTEVPLSKAGWHLIAQPHSGDHALADITVRDDANGGSLGFCDAVGSLVMNPLFYYDPDSMGYLLCGCEGVAPPSQDHTLRMGFGYWLYTFEDYLTLVFP